MQNKVKKIIPYCLILLILVGLFSPLAEVKAQITPGIEPSAIAKAQAAARAAYEAEQVRLKAAPTGDAFKDEVFGDCGIKPWTWPACFLSVGFYYTIFQLPSWILWLSAQFFDVMINLGIDSSVTRASGFIPAAWGVTRDFSNIFFILILLYVAIQTILGMGHETKKIIVRVIIMALLINFSMFFTKVVIDSSNILALVFYNKLEIKNADGTSRPKDPALQTGKDISGAMWKTFDATQLMTPKTITLLKTTTVEGITKEGSTIPLSLRLGIMVIAGSIMLFAAYAFFVAGLMFIGRLIELWVLIIFSPFAFMSWPIPLLRGTDYIGWDNWSKRLIATSFMAPIFMFFIYFIFMLLPKISEFTRGDTTTILGTILAILIPAMIVLALLLKATHFAKKGGGRFGELIMKGAKIAGGLAVGAATGGTAMLAAGTIGKFASSIANNDALKAKAAAGDKGAQRKLALANSFANKSFDLRQTGLGKFVGTKTGMDFNKGTGVLGLDTKKFEGGRKAQEERKIEEEQKKQKTYELSGDAAIKQVNRNAQYEEDKKVAKQAAQAYGFEFNEKNFREDYEKGGDMASHGLNKTVDKGSVGTTAEINAERRTAYANSLDTQREKEKAQGAMKTFWEEWKKGAKKMVTTPGGLATTATLGVTTMGIGAVASIIGGGFLHALKQTLSVRATNAEVVAGVRRGEDKDKKLLKLLDERRKEHEAETHTAPAHPPATPTAPANSAPSHPSAGSGGGHP